MKPTTTITAPDGQEVDLEKSTIVFKPIDTRALRLEDIEIEDEPEKLKTCQKVELYTRIQRIANYYNKYHANGWKANWNDASQPKFTHYKDCDKNIIAIESYRQVNIGMPPFATNKLAELAYDNNREIFDRFFDF